MASTDPVTEPDTATPALLDITPLVAASSLPDPTDDAAGLLGILQRIADKLGCDVVPRGGAGDDGTERVIRR